MSLSVSGPADVAEDASRPRRAPRRAAGSWLVTAVVLLLVAMAAHTLAGNGNFHWAVVWHYFHSGEVLVGLARTLEITAVSMVIAIVIGTVLAVMRLSTNRVLAGVAWVYVWLFRSVPLLVQLLFWYNLAALYKRLSFGVPFGPALVSGNVNHLITPFVAAILGLGLHESAYMGEIIRGGVAAVPRGQSEAAAALGMSRGQTIGRIVLPQALRVIIPPTGNEIISALKASSLVSVLSMTDLLYSVQIIYSRDFQTIPLLIVACLWYLIVTSVLSVGQFYLERRTRRGFSRSRESLLANRFAGGRRRAATGGGS